MVILMMLFKVEMLLGEVSVVAEAVDDDKLLDDLVQVELAVNADCDDDADGDEIRPGDLLSMFDLVDLDGDPIITYSL